MANRKVPVTLNYDMNKIVGEAEVREDGTYVTKITDIEIAKLVEQGELTCVTGGKANLLDGSYKITDVALVLPHLAKE